MFTSQKQFQKLEVPYRFCYEYRCLICQPYINNYNNTTAYTSQYKYRSFHYADENNDSAECSLTYESLTYWRPDHCWY